MHKPDAAQMHHEIGAFLVLRSVEACEVEIAALTLAQSHSFGLSPVQHTDNE